MDQIELVAEDVRRFVSQHVANSADAADISQEVLTIACANLETYTGHNDEGLFAIARRLIVDYDRASSQVDFVAINPAVSGEKESALRVPPDSVVATCDVRERVTNWLRRCDEVLEPGQQVAVLLADIYGYADKDSAAMLGMTLPSFKTLLHTSRARLRAFDERAGQSRNAIRRSRIGVVCHVSKTKLRQLREYLLDGVQLAMQSV
ncbi:MAG TPA: RNA polymerase sigma factor [Vicinamibacterales bacterium]|nr:RNA polymerase sigma factor [Vicinamibacterales bacterium]